VAGTGGRQTLLDLVMVSKKLSRFMVVTASPARSAASRRRCAVRQLQRITTRVRCEISA
jgi:hypothetical protein